MRPAFAETKSGTPRFYWNLDDVVGLNGVNKFEDVIFVQWCLYKMGNWQPASKIWPGLKKVNINGTCSGRADDPLVNTIQLAQAEFGGEMDGRVSPMKNSAKFTHQGISHLFMIMTMNMALSQLYPQHYPRLDLMPEFIWRIKDKVTYPFVYSG